MERICLTDQRHCQPCEGGVLPLSDAEVLKRLASLEGWRLEGNRIEKEFRFANHFEAMAFVNAVAWISHREDHHPQVTLGYADCRIAYWTHAIGGLSENDFICAGKVEALLKI